MALANFHNSVCKLLPEKDFPNAGGPPQTAAALRQPRTRVGGGLQGRAASRCRTSTTPARRWNCCYLGNVASAVDRPLEFDPATMKIINDAEADAPASSRPTAKAGAS